MTEDVGIEVRRIAAITPPSPIVRCEIDREPQPGDGPEYEINHWAWAQRKTSNADYLKRLGL